MPTRMITFAAAGPLSITALHAADWPQWQGPDRTRRVERDRPPEAMAHGRAGGCVDGDRTWRRLRFDGGRGRSRVRARRARPQQRRHCAESRGWKRSLVEGAGCISVGRPRTGTARHTDRRWRSPLRAQRERRSAVRQDRWHRCVAAQYPPRFQRAASPTG